MQIPHAPRLSDVRELRMLSSLMLGSGETAIAMRDPEVEMHVATVMRSYADDGAVLARLIGGTSLDGSAASLATLDALLDSLSARIAAVPELAADHSLLLTLAHKFGAYLGEVLRREIGGGWELPARGDQSLAWRATDGRRREPSIEIFHRLVGRSTLRLAALIRAHSV